MSDRTVERTGMINIRIKPTDRALIDQAAAVQGKKRSEFMLDASRRAAEETLLVLGPAPVAHDLAGRQAPVEALPSVLIRRNRVPIAFSQHFLTDFRGFRVLLRT